jgi:hypothetical protein
MGSPCIEPDVSRTGKRGVFSLKLSLMVNNWGTVAHLAAFSLTIGFVYHEYQPKSDS